jgi:hypothetical protein
MFKLDFLGLNGAMMFVLTELMIDAWALAGTAGVALYDVASRIPENVRNSIDPSNRYFSPTWPNSMQKNILELEEVLNNSMRFVGFSSKFSIPHSYPVSRRDRRASLLAAIFE